MAEKYQFIPTNVLEDEARYQEASSWASGQRQWMAQTWADNEMAALYDMLAPYGMTPQDIEDMQYGQALQQPQQPAQPLPPVGQTDPFGSPVASTRPGNQVVQDLSGATPYSPPQEQLTEFGPATAGQAARQTVQSIPETFQEPEGPTPVDLALQELGQTATAFVPPIGVNEEETQRRTERLGQVRDALDRPLQTVLDPTPLIQSGLESAGVPESVAGPAAFVAGMAAPGPTGKLTGSANAANRALGEMLEQAGKLGGAAGLPQRLEQVRRAVVRVLTDEGVDLAEFQKQAQRAKGAPLSADEMASELSRLDPNKAAQVAIQKGLRPAIQAVKDDKDWLSGYLIHQDNIDVANATAGKVLRQAADSDAPIRGQAALRGANQRSRALEQQRALALSEGRTEDAAQLERRIRAAGRSVARGEQRVEQGQQARLQGAAAKGQQAAQERKFSSGIKVADSEQALQDMAAELGPERMQRVEQAAQQVWSFGHRMLARKRDAGIISQELYDALTQQYPHYVPTRILDYLKEPQRIGVGKSLGLNDPGLRRASIEGTERFREDPLASMVRLAHETERLARKNEAANAFIKLRDMLPDGDQLIREVPDSVTATRDFVKMHVFTNGQRRTFLVPKEIERTIRAESRSPIPGLSQAMGVFRALATSRNPLFLASNALLDAATFAIRESSRAGGPQNLPKVLGELIPAYVDAFKGLGSGTYKGDTARFLQQGGGMFGFFSGSEKQTRQTVAELARHNAIDIRNAGDLRRAVGDLLTLKPVEAIGERIELAPRVAAMRLAEKRGLNTVQSTINGRSVTIDFAQGGTLSKLVNQFVPFFNVGMQATAQPVRAFKENPTGFVTTAATLLTTPVLAAEAWNRADPQRAQDYADVPQYIKDQGVVIMLPTEAPTDAQGNRRPQFALIRLREYAPFAILTREAAQRALGDDPREWGELIGSTIESVSPVEGLGFQEPTDLASAVGSFIPPPAKTALELGVNRDFYRGSYIATERNDERASEASKAVAGATGVRPSQVEHGLRSNFPGTGGLALDASNLANPNRPQGGTPQDVPVAGAAVRRFVRSDIGGNLQKARERSLSEESQRVLRESGVTMDVGTVPREIKKVPLTVAEQAGYQQRVNDAVNRAIPQLAQSESWARLGADAREKVVRSMVQKLRDRISEQVLAEVVKEVGGEGIRKRLEGLKR